MAVCFTSISAPIDDWSYDSSIGCRANTSAFSAQVNTVPAVLFCYVFAAIFRGLQVLQNRREESEDDREDEEGAFMPFSYGALAGLSGGVVTVAINFVIKMVTIAVSGGGICFYPFYQIFFGVSESILRLALPLLPAPCPFLQAEPVFLWPSFRPSFFPFFHLYSSPIPYSVPFAAIRTGDWVVGCC